MKNKLKRFLIMTIGCFLSSTGVYCFAVSAGVPVTGVAGITSILYRLFNLPMGITNIIINIPIILVCYKYLGKKYFIRSAYCMLMYAFFTDYILINFPIYQGDRLLSSICCGIIMSIGDALIYMSNASTGGFDFISVTIKIKNPHIPLGNIILGTAVFIILLNGLVFSDIDSMIYGFILNYISSRVVNRVLVGSNQSMLILIVTTVGKQLCDKIVETVDRGSTILKGFGGYKQEDKDVVMCACTPRELFEVKKVAKEVDRDAFIIMLESNEIHGNGFKNLEFGATQEE